MYSKNFSKVMLLVGKKKLASAGFFDQLNQVIHIPKWILDQHDVLDHYYNPSGEILPTTLSGEWLADYNRLGRVFADYGRAPTVRDWEINIRKFQEAVYMDGPYTIPEYSWLLECYEYWRYKLRDFQ